MTFAMPPAWCSRACKNALTDVCCEKCAIKRDGSYFDPKEDVGIRTCPGSRGESLVEEMSPRERLFCMGL